VVIALVVIPARQEGLSRAGAALEPAGAADSPNLA